MKDQEVADLGGIQFLLVVIFGDVARADATRRQHADEAQHRALDQMDRGRFQRLHEAARQADGDAIAIPLPRSEEHTSELQSLMRISYAVFCLKKKNKTNNKHKQ